MRVPGWLHRSIKRIEENERLSALGDTLARLSRPLAEGPLAPALRGDWLGHALHPLLTDIPIGCWTSAFLLDLVGGKSARPAAQRLIAMGLLAVVPTAAAGVVDWHDTDGEERRRVGVVHALSNSVAAGTYLLSWQARRRGRHGRGVVLGTLAGGAATIDGHLGGHLVFGRTTGVGERGTDELVVPSPEEHELDGMIGA